VDGLREDDASRRARRYRGREAPGPAKPEELRAVDWITKEEITMTTTTATVPAEVAEQVRTRRAGGETLAELRKAFPDLSAAAIRSAVADAEPTTPAEKAQRPSREDADREDARHDQARSARRAGLQQALGRQGGEGSRRVREGAGGVRVRVRREGSPSEAASRQVEARQREGGRGSGRREAG
jgi:hypothetical protein